MWDCTTEWAYVRARPIHALILWRRQPISTPTSLRCCARKSFLHVPSITDWVQSTVISIWIQSSYVPPTLQKYLPPTHGKCLKIASTAQLTPIFIPITMYFPFSKCTMFLPLFFTPLLIWLLFVLVYESMCSEFGMELIFNTFYSLQLFSK